MQELGLQVANVAGRDLLVGADAIARMQQELDVEFVSANILVDGKPLLKPYIILTKRLGNRGVRIGITGVTMKSRSAVEAWPDANLEFQDASEAAREVLEVLRTQTDVRILLAHLTTAALEQLHDEMPFGYDLLVSSTGELRETTPIGETPVVLSPGSRGKHLAWLNLRFERPGSVLVTSGEVLRLDKKIEDDAEMAARVARLKEQLGTRPAAGEGRVTTTEAPAPTANGPSP
jgi:2',3'-cyclic-nucleotide 2'-phosphodiesterase (5'-nucleotidase family)